MDWSLLLPPLALIVVFPLLWCGILWLLSSLSGWRTLAKQFPLDGNFGTPVTNWASGSIGAGLSPVQFKNAVRVAVDDNSIRFDVVLPALGAFPPIEVPWESVASVAPTPVLFGEAIKLEIRGWPGRIVLRGKAASAIRECWESRPPAESREPRRSRAVRVDASGAPRLVLLFMALLFVGAVAAALFIGTRT